MPLSSYTHVTESSEDRKMEEEGVSHGHLELLHPFLLQFSCLEEQLIALSTLVLNQEKHVSPLQGSRVQNEGAHPAEGGTTSPSIPSPVRRRVGPITASLLQENHACTPVKGCPEEPNTHP